MGGRMILVALAAAMACGPPPAPEGDVAPLIHATVLRYEAKQFMSGERLPTCIRIHGHAGEIAAAVRDALRQSLPDVRSAEACVIVGGDVYLAGSRVPAALLTSGPIRCIAADEVEVAGGFAQSGSVEAGGVTQRGRRSSTPSIASPTAARSSSAH